VIFTGPTGEIDPPILAIVVIVYSSGGPKTAVNCDDNTPIKNAVLLLKKQIDSGRFQKYYPINEIPLDFIPKSLHKYVIEKIKDPKDNQYEIEVINGNRYEYMIYMQLNKMLDSGQYLYS
jgi:hypothetical protein